jgi:hypothetical protein
MDDYETTTTTTTATASFAMDKSSEQLERTFGGGEIPLILGNEVTGEDSNILQQGTDLPWVGTPTTTATTTMELESIHITPVDEIIELLSFGEENSLNVTDYASVVNYEFFCDNGGLQNEVFQKLSTRLR